MTHAARASLKRLLSAASPRTPADGLTVLIYHRVGGDTRDERDLSPTAFREQMHVLTRHRVLHIDEALGELVAGDDRPKVVITFDDGFADIETTALPILAEHGLPFTLYLATAYVGGTMHWDGSTATAAGPALTWDQVGTLMGSGLCTIGNHTHTHARPEKLDAYELDRCTKEIESRLGMTPQHFAYPWGVTVPAMESALRTRFRSTATGAIGRARHDAVFWRLPRVPVRGSDPLAFFSAKLTGSLRPERTYAALVGIGKSIRPGHLHAIQKPEHQDDHS